jgi:hypothetical protein
MFEKEQAEHNAMDFDVFCNYMYSFKNQQCSS